MCGALVVSCTRYGALVKSPSRSIAMWRLDTLLHSLNHLLIVGYSHMQVIRMIDDGYRLPPSPGLTKELYKIMIQCWSSLNICICDFLY